MSAFGCRQMDANHSEGKQGDDTTPTHGIYSSYFRTRAVRGGPCHGVCRYKHASVETYTERSSGGARERDLFNGARSRMAPPYEVAGSMVGDRRLDFALSADRRHRLKRGQFAPPANKGDGRTGNLRRLHSYDTAYACRLDETAHGRRTSSSAISLSDPFKGGWDPAVGGSYGFNLGKESAEP